MTRVYSDPSDELRFAQDLADQTPLALAESDFNGVGEAIAVAVCVRTVVVWIEVVWHPITIRIVRSFCRVVGSVSV